MNTNTPDGIVIAALVAALSAVCGTLAWIVRWSINRSDELVERADERVKLLENERSQTLTTMTTNLAAITHMVEVMMGLVNELRSWSVWDRQSKGGGQQPQP